MFILGKGQRMKDVWMNRILDNPIRILVLSFIAIFVLSIGMKNLYFRGDYKVYFEKDNPELLAFENMQSDFTKNDSVNIVIAPHNKQVFDINTLTLIWQLTDAAWQTPLSTRVDSITNFQHTRAEFDDLVVEDLVLDPDLLNESSLAYIESTALAEPNLVDFLVSSQGHVAVISILISLPEGDQTAAVKEVTSSVTALTEQFKQQYPNHDFYHTGIVYMNHSFATEAQNDASTLIPLMFLAVILVLWLLLKTISGMAATLIIIFTAITATLGIAGWIGIFLSTATVNVPILVMTLAVADCVHVIASTTYAMAQGESKRQAIKQSLSINFLPIFITSFTTAIGFLTLNFSDVPILKDLGNVTAIGVLLAFVFSITILPSLLILMPVQIKQTSNSSALIERIGEWVIKHRRALMPMSVLFSAVFISFSYFNEVNDVATEYFHESTRFRQASNFQEQNVSGMITIDFAIDTQHDSGLNNPDTIFVVDKFSDWLRQQPEVDYVSTISDTFKRLNKSMHEDNDDFYALPETQELAAQYLLLYELSLPFGLDLNNQLNIDKSATRINVILKNLGSKEITGFEQKANTWMAENGIDYRLTAGSPNLMFSHIGEKNMNSMLKGSVAALILISALLIFALKSLRLGLISLIPNLVPAGIGFGIWGVFSGQVNLGLSVVISMTLGIIVDDTVHFLTKYQHARKLGGSSEQSVRYAFSSVGRALFITTLVLAAGFGVLAMSSFSLNAHMGILTSIIIVTALLVDFFLLPPILMLFDNKLTSKQALESN